MESFRLLHCSFTCEVDKRRRLTAPEECPVRMTKRNGQELAIDITKRRRIMSEQVPVLKVPQSTCAGKDVQELSVPSEILPNRRMNSTPIGLVSTNHCVQLLLSGAAGLKQVACPCASMFLLLHPSPYLARNFLQLT